MDIMDTKQLFSKSLLFFLNLGWTAVCRWPIVLTSLLVLFDVNLQVDININQIQQGNNDGEAANEV